MTITPTTGVKTLKLMKHPFILLVILAMSCNAHKGDDSNATPQPFVITSAKPNSLVTGRDYAGVTYYAIGNGSIRNLSGVDLNHYELDIRFILYTRDGKSAEFDNDDRHALFRDDGFRKQKIKNSFSKKIWKINETIPFNIKDYVDIDDLIIPVEKVELLYFLRASNDFDYSFSDYLTQEDFTTEWKAFQKAKLPKDLR